MKKVLVIVFIFSSLVTLQAQQKSAAELKEYFYDAEFFFAQEEYPDALYDYLELYNNGFNGYANINYRIGICYLNIPGQKEKAIPYLLEAVKDISKKYNETSIKQKSAPYDTWLFLGNAYRVNNRLTDAISAYNKYKEIVGIAEEIKYADKQILACNTARKYMDNPLKIRLTNLGDSVNSTSSNFKGVVSGNGRVILYMNELPFYDAVYFSKYTGQGWSSPVNITPQIQSDGDQYVSCMAFDGNELFLTREDAFNSDIYVSRFQGGRWSKSVPVDGLDLNTKFWESHASVSKDGKTMYFTSNRKGGIGEMDIYVSRLQADGRWGQPVNMGTNINTPLNEDTPFVTENDSILYFSSQGHDNMGGYDIFMTKLDAAGNWSVPSNIGYPVNTTDDDLFYYPWDNARVGYISRIEDDSYGKEDIYAIQPAEDTPLKDLLAEFFGPVKPDQVKPETQAETITGNTADSSTAVKPEVLPGTNAKTEPKEIEVDPIYFEYDNFNLSDFSRRQLEILYGLLNEYPSVRIRMVGHADAMGRADYNQVLSEKRAVTSKNYLVAKGIDPTRIETLGMGEKNFRAINSNADGSDNPEGRQLNRRVEYEIIGSGDAIMKIKMTPVPDHLKFKGVP